jgi:hypothetical protein
MMRIGPSTTRQALDSVFSWQEERTMSRNLVVHYKRVSYLVEPTKDALELGRRKVSRHEWQDGRVEIRCGSLSLPYSTVEKEPHVSPRDVVENKRLGAVLATILAAQTNQARRGSVGLAEDDGRAEGPAPSPTARSVG